MVHITQQSQRAAETSVTLKLCFGFCNIIDPVHAALRCSLHSGRNRYSVLGKTTLEELSRTTKEMEVNKAFFMSASDPHSCNPKDFATVTRK